MKSKVRSELELESYWESSARERTLEGRRLEEIQWRRGRVSSYWKGHSKLSGSNASQPSNPNSPSNVQSFAPLIFSTNSLSYSTALSHSSYCLLHTQANNGIHIHKILNFETKTRDCLFISFLFLLFYLCFYFLMNSGWTGISTFFIQN